MSKKSVKLNVQVKLGKKTYQPGEPVPIGTNGLSDADVRNLTENFGLYSGDAPIGAPSDDHARDVAERDARIATLEQENAEGLEKLKSAGAQIAALKTQVSEAEADNGVLAARVKELEAAAK